MTNRDRILTLLSDATGPLCDDCIAKLAPLTQRQVAHKYCTELALAGKINRQRESCVMCAKVKLVSRDCGGTPAVSPVSGPVKRYGHSSSDTPVSGARDNTDFIPPRPQGPAQNQAPPPGDPKEQHFTIQEGDSGYTYESIMGPYLKGAGEITIEDPYIRFPHQVQNLVRLCETLVKSSSIRRITLTTHYEESYNAPEIRAQLAELRKSLLQMEIVLTVQQNPNLHDREIRLDSGWVIKIGRGLDLYQKPDGYFGIGSIDLSLRKCKETKVDIFRASATTR